MESQRSSRQRSRGLIAHELICTEKKEKKLQKTMNTNVNVWCLSLLLLLNFTGAKPVSDLQVGYVQLDLLLHLLTVDWFCVARSGSDGDDTV